MRASPGLMPASVATSSRRNPGRGVARQALARRRRDEAARAALAGSHPTRWASSPPPDGKAVPANSTIKSVRLPAKPSAICISGCPPIRLPFCHSGYKRIRLRSTQFEGQQCDAARHARGGSERLECAPPLERPRQQSLPSDQKRLAARRIRRSIAAARLDAGSALADCVPSFTVTSISDHTPEKGHASGTPANCAAP